VRKQSQDVTVRCFTGLAFGDLPPLYDESVKLEFIKVAPKRTFSSCTNVTAEYK
jgi:hypothetical protein